MGKVDGGSLVGRTLADEGVEQAFVLCGGHIMPALYGMRNAGIEIIDMRHECSALYAAIAYTRATGKIAAVITTAGPGVGNTAAGMMEADSMNIPVVHIGGAVALAKRDAGDLQDMSTLGLMESISKWARKVTIADRIPEYVSMAFRHATDANPGPVYLEIPTDLLFTKVDEASLRPSMPSPAAAIAAGHPDLIEQAAELLAGAERPALLLDDGARPTIGSDAAAVADLSDHLKMPVGIAGNGCRGLFGNESSNRLLNTNAMRSADVVLAMGCRFDYRWGHGRSIAKEAKVIQVHTDRSQIGFNVRADIAIVGGTGPVARQLLDSVGSMREAETGDSWVGPVGGKTTADLPEVYRDPKTPIHPARCAGEAAKFLEEMGRDWSLVIDGGEASVWMGGASTAYKGGQIHATGPNGTIGTGPGLAIGAWAATGKPVLWYTGDGSFGFYSMEMETMARLGMPVVCVISNDSSWGMISLVEKHIRPEEIEEMGSCNTDLHPMRAYEKIVAMWDGHGEQVTDPDEILPAIKRAAANGRPSIVNVQIDNESLSPFISPYVEMVKGTS
ncbi:MAG: thiamine pyrophosphate-binding protein [Actinomycetia bacterium]|nr:thiamine pyrophosphate-binding protein [Actinomycetes bacterium]MCP4222484.1 thiamine pyrophosphate-binding protein [Actinomycetes bacterium]MCP5030532.1 thiamine pyrophosphate-binding protein [Actinomycetes bacterium]